MRQSPEVYRRRRIGAAVAAVAVLWGTLQAASGVTNWFAGDDAAASGGLAAVVATSVPECPSPEVLDGPVDEVVPADLAADVAAILAHPDVMAAEVSLSVWVDGWGEVAARSPELALRPASNQKLLVAIGALELLDPTDRLVTRLAATAPIEGDTIDGDLVVVGGGDPTFWDVGDGSLYEMAEALAEAGVRRVTGALWGDESRYDQVRRAPGWTDNQIPGDAAPMSALTVRANRIGDTPEYLADPTAGNLAILLGYLREQGITVDGGYGGTVGDAADLPAPATVELYADPSPTIERIVQLTLKNSDNVAAELLLKEIDRATGGPGSTAGGLEAARRVVEGWCLPLSGTDDDGSGLSYDNRRSARELRRMLQLAQRQDWWPMLDAGLPVAGDPDGTLTSRFSSPATVGNLRAKTGTIRVARALTGVFTTAGGRQATFSVLVNSDVDPRSAMGRLDLLLERVAAEPG